MVNHFILIVSQGMDVPHIKKPYSIYYVSLKSITQCASYNERLKRRISSEVEGLDFVVARIECFAVFVPALRFEFKSHQS